MIIDHVKSLTLARAKLTDKRRALAKRDSITDRDEGFAERIIAIQNAIEATDRAIAEEEAHAEEAALNAETPEETPA